MRVLAADIGGTNTRLAIAEIAQHQRRVLVENEYSSADYSCFVDVLSRFLNDHNNLSIDAACLAVAGPVKSGEASVTNLPWVISEQQIKQQFKIHRVKLINDFIANAYGISELNDSDFVLVQQGSATDNQDAVVIGAGTGLGAAHLVWQQGQLLALPAEAGHAEFSPQNELQINLLIWLRKQYGYVSNETLLSGSGLFRIYRFMHEVMGFAESKQVKQSMTDNDPAEIITNNALSGEDLLCEKTLDCFVAIYGSTVGNIVLHYYPVAQIYIAGGIAPRIKNYISSECFVSSLVSKGPMTENLKQLTIKLINQPKVGLYGAMAYGSYI